MPGSYHWMQSWPAPGHWKVRFNSDSPHYAPVIEPTLPIGVTALVTSVRTWLPPS